METPQAKKRIELSDLVIGQEVFILLDDPQIFKVTIREIIKREIAKVSGGISGFVIMGECKLPEVLASPWADSTGFENTIYEVNQMIWGATLQDLYDRIPVINP